MAMTMVCKFCGHSKYIGGEHDCPVANRTIYGYDPHSFVAVDDAAPQVAPEPIVEPVAEVVTDTAEEVVTDTAAEVVTDTAEEVVTDTAAEVVTDTVAEDPAAAE